MGVLARVQVRSADPQASVLTNTVPAPGSGSGSVSATISPFRNMAARIGILLAFLLPPI
jgi:hypothetical protein